MEQLFLHSGPVRSFIIEKTHFHRFGPFWKESPPMEIEKREMDLSGRLILLEKPEYREYYAYLKGGGIAAAYRFGQEGELIRREVYFYRDGKRDVKDIFEGDAPPRRVEYREEPGLIIEKEGSRIRGRRFDKEGKILSEYLYHGEEPDLIVKYAYDGDGRLLTKREEDKRGTPVGRTEYIYNDSGLVLEEKEWDGEGKVTFHRIFRYPGGDDANWLVREEFARGGGKKLIPLAVIHRSLTFYHDPGENRPKEEEKGKPPVPSPPLRKGPETIAFANGYYRGPLKEGHMEGEGVFTFNDGGRYEGQFRRGVMEGHGRLTKSDGSRYEGEFREGRMHGRGLLIWKDGSRYEGPFSEGLMDGVGQYTWPNGDRFRGLFEKGRRTDQGIIEPAE